MIGTAEVARCLGVSPQRVRQMVQSGQLSAQKLGRDWLVDEKDLVLVKDRKPGRPRKLAAKKKTK